MSDQEGLHRVVRHVKNILVAEVGYRNHCILATKVLILFAKERGHHLHAIPVKVIFLQPKLAALCDTKIPDKKLFTAKKVSDHHVASCDPNEKLVVCGHAHEFGDVTYSDAYNGHLVAMSRKTKRFIDLTPDQFYPKDHKPGYLNLPLPKKFFDPAGECLHHTLPTGCAIAYHPGTDKSYYKKTHWQTTNKEVKRLLNLCRRRSSSGAAFTR